MSRKRRDRAARPAVNRDAPREFRLASTGCTIRAAEGETKLATFEGVAYTGQAMQPMGWWNEIIIDLAGVQVPSEHRPALRQHDHEQIVGHTTAVSVDQDGIKIGGVFSGQTEHVEKVTVPARNGFRWQLSVGADPVRTEFLEAGEKTEVNGREVVGPMTISRETRLGEISFVPLGADQDTSVEIAASKGSPMNPFRAALKQLMADLRAAGKVEAAKYTDEQIDKMTVDEARAAVREMSAAEEDEEDDDEEEKKDEEAAKAAARLNLQAEAGRVVADLRRNAAAEHQRQADITAAVRRHGVTDVEIEAADGKKVRVNLVAHAIAENWSVERAELYALRAARPQGPVGVPGGLGYSTTTPAINEAVIEAAVLHTARHQFRLNDDSFFHEPTPDGRGTVRRVPEHLQRETQGELRARYTDQVQQAAHTLFRGRMGAHQLFELAFRVNGSTSTLDMRSESGIRSMLREWDHMEGLGLRAEGSSNLSISNILANVLNKFALQGYLYVEQAWREIAGIRPVNDFKPSKSINLLGDVMYKALGPTGELANASLGDQAFANQAEPYGRILTIPWTHLVNDDLGILTGVPLKIGQGAGLALNDVFWTVVAAMAAGTVNADDGAPFFNSTGSPAVHKATPPNGQQRAGANKISGAGSALSSTSLTTLKAMFDKQVDPNGNPLGFDGATPILLHPPTLWRTVAELLYAPTIVYGGASAALQPNMNVWAGMMKPVMSRYLENANYGNSATGWYILFNPAALAVIEVAFLGGVDTPAVLQAGPDYQFDRLGISIRGTMPFGVTQQNFRAGYYAVGA